ncbi:MAG: hypothetical protein M3040_17540 [Bacteroidota bacterium]|nr:hypothetical protein [Bacteroidota bacterium]
MTQHSISRIAVIILGVIMIVFGFYHWFRPANLIVFIPDFLHFLPGKLLVYLVGVAFVLAGIAFIAHKYVQIAGYMLATLLIVFVLTIHLPNYFGAADPDMRSMAFVNLLKDTALAAFAMYIGSEARNLPE